MVRERAEKKVKPSPSVFAVLPSSVRCVSFARVRRLFLDFHVIYIKWKMVN